MERIRKIMVTTDFSDTSKKAFDYARQLADKFEAGLLALHVQEIQLPPMVVEYGGAGLPEIERQHQEQALQMLKDAVKPLGANVETLVATGTPHLEIVRVAEDENVDMIVMATHGRGFFSHAFLGSTAERVVRRAPCPVLVVRGREDKPQSGDEDP